SKYLKSQGISNLRLAAREARGNPILPYEAAQRAAELVGEKSESLILVELYDSARTFFERNAD
ncbi:MAG: hypothetical protein Q8O83_00130, partial [bacterium]|nr:hypothetical protein [bacterium]